jgi:hypothetical protein
MLTTFTQNLMGLVKMSTFLALGYSKSSLHILRSEEQHRLMVRSYEGQIKKL